MPPTKASQGKGKITWNGELKSCLHIMHTDFDLHRTQRVQIFNIVFKRYLTSCGLAEGAESNTIESQYHERKKPTARDWPSVCQPPATARDIEAREALRTRIREALSTLQSQYRPATATEADQGPSVAPQSSAPVESAATPVRSSRFRAAVAQATYHPPTTPQPTTLASAFAVIPRVATKRRATLATPAAAAKQKASTSRSPKVAHYKKDGTKFMKSPHTTVHQRPDKVSEWAAHPPLSGLLFRYWEEDPMCDRDSSEGFWSRKYHKSDVLDYVPPGSNSVMNDIFKHLNKKPVDSPFISTSSSLLWIISEKLLKGLKDGNTSGRLTIIDATALKKETVFYVNPFHRAIKKTYAFTDGAWRYAGTNEYLVWRDIPRRAILHTFNSRDLLQLSASSQSVHAALRLEVLDQPRTSLVGGKVPMLRSGNVQLNADIVVGLTKLCKFFGLDAHSSMEHISHIVSDVVQGWVLQVERRERHEWDQLATIFAENIAKRSTAPVSVTEKDCMKMAFLNGVSWGDGPINARHSAELIARKDRKAKAKGLAEPDKIVLQQYEASRLQVVSYQLREKQRLEKHHEQRPSLLAGPEDGHDDEDEMDMVDEDVGLEIEEDVEPTTPMQVDEDEQITYDDDYDDELMA
ncbi:hypothetical protein M409DRAFT_17671 [Zasmidium cellare ATCC 36951]|uniref:DUF7587 domain-containing protein n=1 Tax=Zasmidium cellare ATCC 36951 TaxID=1080233 RepID=A0A6A6D1X0_ZASCE|nr:uncharacterized protein M409DRAFT_17671 [Zasmidium cellare ATCC 36951]KAF2172438.1 hypothetical protein M409DRAFT_17671 [Zasmidium cellare ATCC 36951]